MTKRLATAALLAAAALSLAGCSGSPDDPKGSAEVNYYQFKGETIECLAEGIGQNRVMSCDYVGFYAAHPDLLPDVAKK